METNNNIKTVNLLCSCGGFCSQLYFIISWILVLQNKKVNIAIKNDSCKYNCQWKKAVKNNKIWDSILDINFINDTLKSSNSDIVIDTNTIYTKHKEGVHYNGTDINNNTAKINNIYSLRNVCNHNIKKDFISLISDKEKFPLVRNEFNKVIKKYIKFSDTVLNSIDKYGNYFEKYTIGLHIRSSQHYNLSNKHTTKTIIDNMFLELKELPKPEEFNVFIATSNSQILNYVKNNYPQYSYFNIDTLRENFTIDEKNENEFTTNDWTRIPNYKEDINSYGILKYYNEVCQDLLLLSKCNYLIGGESNVFFNALCINKDIEYSIPKILSNTGHL
jgi:hypothetical protein